MNGVIRFALGIASMPDQVVNDLDRSLPGFARIAAAAKELEPILQKGEPHAEALAPLLAQAMPHIQELMPLIAQAMPIIKRVWPDIVAVTPTIEELIEFANRK